MRFILQQVFGIFLNVFGVSVSEMFQAYVV